MGLASIPATAYGEKQLWLDVSLGEDRLVSQFGDDLDTISLWHFDIPYRYDGVGEGERRTFIFTDRDIYKPGETVHLKCVSRAIDSDSLLDPRPGKAQLTVKDNRGREVVDKACWPVGWQNPQDPSKAGEIVLDTLDVSHRSAEGWALDNRTQELVQFLEVPLLATAGVGGLEPLLHLSIDVYAPTIVSQLRQIEGEPLPSSVTRISLDPEDRHAELFTVELRQHPRFLRSLRGPVCRCTAATSQMY